jgi:hypothetical protein
MQTLGTWQWSALSVPAAGSSGSSLPAVGCGTASTHCLVSGDPVDSVGTLCVEPGSTLRNCKAGVWPWGGAHDSNRFLLLMSLGSFLVLLAALPHSTQEGA